MPNRGKAWNGKLSHLSQCSLEEADTAGLFHISQLCDPDHAIMSTFLTAEWRKLIMAPYEVSPTLLAPYLPRGVELDLYPPAPGAPPRCYVSLVAFLFDRVRLKGLAIPRHTS